MRRGLIAWSKAELPEAVFAARLQRLRAAMAAEGLDAFIAYTNNTRTAAVAWLTNFVPYWAEGLLVVPLSGEPLLTMAFSNRIVGWGKGVSCVARFEGGARPGQAAGKYLGTLGARIVGVADFDGLRQAVAQDLIDAAPQAQLRDATELFVTLRSKSDPAEIALAAKAGTIAHDALSAARGDEAELGAALAAIEHEARLAGAEEVYLAAAPDLARDRRLIRPEGTIAPGASYAIRATIAYKGSWVRMTRTIFREPGKASVLSRAAEAFASAASALPRLDGFRPFPSWSIEGCRLAQPLDAYAGASIAEPRAIPEGALVTAQAVMTIDGQTVAIAAPVLVGGEAFPSSLLVAPVFGQS